MRQFLSEMQDLMRRTAGLRIVSLWLPVLLVGLFMCLETAPSFSGTVDPSKAKVEKVRYCSEGIFYMTSSSSRIAESYESLT